MTTIDDLSIKLFADGADVAGILELARNPHIKGFTTNPTLMRGVGVTDYEAYARDLLAKVPDRPISLEVFADDFDEMERQALKIASWAANANVKIPVMNTKRESAAPLIEKLSKEGVVLNITAIMTAAQVREVETALSTETPAIVSVFAGRVADTGADPIPIMTESARILEGKPKAELLWASTREAFNIVEAERVGCKIITAPNDVIKKILAFGMDLDDLSHKAVEIFRKDAVASGFHIA